MQTETKILNAQQVSEQIFGGTKSPWSIGQAARKNQIPHFRIGNRIFFELNTIQAWAVKEMEKSMQSMVSNTAQNGIRRIR